MSNSFIGLHGALKINAQPLKSWRAIGDVEHGQCSSLIQLLLSKTLMPQSEAMFFYTQFSKENTRVLKINPTLQQELVYYEIWPSELGSS